MTYVANEGRYATLPYRRCGKSGLKLPIISLGLWQNFGGVDDFQAQVDMLRFAFDQGIAHFDLANNYGPPYGSAEENFGTIFKDNFKPYRDELIISSKAGWDMWPGAYGGMGGSRKHLIASCDQSLKRMGLDYVDIFYSHRPDKHTPLEETMGALVSLYQQGKALYVGISNYGPELTQQAAAILRSAGVPLLISQPNYSILHRWIEKGLLDTLESEGVGCIVFSPLQQGLLTDKYLKNIPSDSRALKERYLKSSMITEDYRKIIEGLNTMAEGRGQSLAQMAIAFTLHDKRVTSSLIGARTVAQLKDSLGALDNLHFTADEIANITALTAPLNGVFDAPLKATGVDLIDTADANFKFVE